MDNKKNKKEILHFNTCKESYYELLANEGNNKNYKALLDALSDGENYLRQTHRIEVKTFDDTFITELEDGLAAVSKIISNPRTFIKEEQELVEAELAKKVSTLSIRHFATHTQYIRNIDEEDNVIPSKILTIHSETDTAIYENRFIMTLIKKCLAFIQQRYNWIQEHGETYDSDLILLHNKTQLRDVVYEVDTRVKASQPSQDDGNSKKNKELLERLTTLRTNCSYFLRSPFMEQMKGAKDVSSPIHMTNMLLKHPDYHRAYLLWCFLDAYQELGIKFEVTEIDQKFSSQYIEELRKYAANSILMLHSNRVSDELEVSRNITYNPQVIFDLEDVTYADSRFLYDAYPLAKEVPEDPLPPLPAKVREKNEAFKEKLKEQKMLKSHLEKTILNDKDRIVYEEALKRIEKDRLIRRERELLINEADELRKEIDALRNENALLVEENKKQKQDIASLKAKVKKSSPPKKK